MAWKNIDFILNRETLLCIIDVLQETVQAFYNKYGTTITDAENLFF